MKNKLNNDLLVVRKINKEIYKKFKQKALEENKNIGEALNEAMICWLSTRRVAKKPDIRNLLKLNRIVKVDHTVKWSEPDPIIFADFSGKFHSLICVASGNQLLSKIVGDIRLRLKIVRVTSFTSFNRRVDDLLEHKAVFKAIKEKNPSLAKELMIDHQNKVIEYVKRELLIQFYE